MLPIVDTNWCPNLHREGDGFHILRAVAVQSPMPHHHAITDLQSLYQHAETPGLGGLPHGIVAYVDLLSPDALIHIDEMASHDKVKGLHVVLSDGDIDRPELVSGFARIAEHQLSLDISGDVAAIKSCVQALNDNFAIPLIVNLSQCIDDGITVAVNRWAALATDLADLNRASNSLAVKITDLPVGTDIKILSASIKSLVELVGVDRVMFGGSRLDIEKNTWQEFESATRWALAAERNQLFRENAVAIYRVS